jgi:small-conductance mechanosensitive channel
MTNVQSKFRSVIAAFLSLIVFAAIVVGVYLDLDHAIKNGNQDQLQHRLILLTVLMSLPGVIIAFLLGLSVRLVTNPKTRWLVPSILVGAGVGITVRAVANKVQAEQEHRAALPPAKGAIPLDHPRATPERAQKRFALLANAKNLLWGPRDVVQPNGYDGSLVKPEPKTVNRGHQ